jgi:hypothetical protein
MMQGNFNAGDDSIDSKIVFANRGAGQLQDEIDEQGS